MTSLLTNTCFQNTESPESPEQVSPGPVRLAWREGKPAPETMTSYRGAAVVHDNIAYFSQGRNVYSYTISQDKWSKLKPCSCEYFSMAVVNHKLTAIGGWDGSDSTNTLFCSSGSSSEMKWEKLLSPMPTKRVMPAAVTTPTHLVVAGGKTKIELWYGVALSTVEVLNLHTLQWASASSLPKVQDWPSMTLCGEHVYLSGDKAIFSCSAEELVKSCTTNRRFGDSVWTSLPNTATYITTLATLRGCVLTIGGTKRHKNTPTGAIRFYNSSTSSWTSSWTVIGEMPTPRFYPLIAVLPGNELVVVGGENTTSRSSVTEIAHPY